MGGQSCSSASIPSSDGSAPGRHSTDFTDLTALARQTFAQYQSSTPQNNTAGLSVLSRTLSDYSRCDSISSDDSDLSLVIGEVYAQEKLLWGSRLRWVPRQRA